MRIRIYSLLLVLLLTSMIPRGAEAAEPVSIRGTVTASEGSLEGAYVGARANGSTVTTYVMTDSKGEFLFRGLPSGSYTLLTRIPGFRNMKREGIRIESGREAQADVRVEQETDFFRLVEQASNSELLESLPLADMERVAIDSRCSSRCHGASYFVASRFSANDWRLIVSKMESITPVGDTNPPIERPGRGEGEAPPRRGSNTDTDAGDYGSTGEGRSLRDDDHIVQYLAKISGPDSNGFPIKFQPRATGNLTRALVTEYQIPRPGAYVHDLLLDPRGGYVWYNDWRANLVGSVNMKTGEIKEYPIPGRDDRPGGFHSQRWDKEGNLWLGQLWSGRLVRFDVKQEKVTGSWQVPLEWTRTGTVVVCQYVTHPDGPVWTRDALLGSQWKLNPETGVFTPVRNARWNLCDREGNLYGFVGRGVLRKTEPGLQKFTEYRTPTPNALANENRLNLDTAGNVWYGDWESRHIAYLDTQAGKITEFLVVGQFEFLFL